MEPVSISAIVISIIVALSVFFKRIKMKHCKAFCVDSDCADGNKTPPLPTSELNHHPSYSQHRGQRSQKQVPEDFFSSGQSLIVPGRSIDSDTTDERILNSFIPQTLNIPYNVNNVNI